MQPAQEADHLILGRSLLPKTRPPRLPNLFHSTLSVHKPYQEMGGRGKTLKLSRGVVLKDEPYLSPVDVAMNIDMGANAGLERIHTVPRGTEK
ncbi:MAG TPA: hypothetical protein DCZ04_09705 [Syntrophorhabdus aromaticivorans]|nr:hypothetical protein [Syntrophorhabdus aromaticivorans]